MRLKAILFWLAAILYMAFIFYLSSHPVLDITRRFPIIYKLKVIHMVEFGFLSFLFFFAIFESGPVKIPEAIAFAVTATLLYSATDEFHQIFVPTRTARYADIIANGVGAALTQAGITLKLRG